MEMAARRVAAGRRESAGGRVRFSEASKRAALAHVAGLAKMGGSLKQAAGELGIGYETLRRWRDRRIGTRLRAVKVAEPPAARDVVVVVPGGARIEGLDLEGIAALARRLT